jgi:hypothetical protein
VNRKSLHNWICWAQGIYFLLTGLWPLVSIRTFQLVTGKKTDHLVTGSEADHWLVNTVGALVIAIAIVFLSAAWSRRENVDVAFLGISAAIALIAIDVVYVARGAISSVYLVDALLELSFVMLWVVVLWKRRGL